MTSAVNSATAVFYLFLPQSCHNEMGQGVFSFTKRSASNLLPANELLAPRYRLGKEPDKGADREEI